MLTSRPFYFLFLFPLSSIFWWTFEFLNRFVNNWYYTGGENYSGVEYLIFASLPFSTVLPAVMGTKEFLLTFQGMKEGFSDFIPISPRRPRLLSWSSLVLCSLGLVFLGIVPGIAYPLVWLSPLFLIVSLKQLFDEKHVFSGLGVGNWTPVISSAIAALICGVFWEMWNYHSMARWVYSFPGLYRYKIFEMPILGFAGYLPFGLICQSFASLFESCFAGEEH